MIAALALTLLCSLAQGSTPTSPGLRRYGLFIGANDGGAQRVRLRYAESDARAMDEVLRELGGVVEQDRLLLLGPSRGAVLGALHGLGLRLAEGARPELTREVIVYYSGHSDAQGLLLGDERLGYDELRAELAAMPAEVRIVILDSCDSGAFTRQKGGQRRPAFLIDAASQVKGHAFLTSSAVDEAAQESDRIGASFFTHALVSGLRGAADSTGDGRVTLNEAYRFAFDETLARTQQAAGGAQHPGYELELVGSGDIVFTDLRDTSATVRLPAALFGRLFVRDAAGRLAVELEKQPGATLELALKPGTYEVTREANQRLARAQLQVTSGSPQTLEPVAFVPFKPEATSSRGDAAPVLTSPLASVPAAPTDWTRALGPLPVPPDAGLPGAGVVDLLASYVEVSSDAPAFSSSAVSTQRFDRVELLSALQAAAWPTASDAGAVRPMRVAVLAAVRHHGSEVAGSIAHGMTLFFFTLFGAPLFCADAEVTLVVEAESGELALGQGHGWGCTGLYYQVPHTVKAVAVGLEAAAHALRPVTREALVQAVPRLAEAFDEHQPGVADRIIWPSRATPRFPAVWGVERSGEKSDEPR